MPMLLTSEDYDECIEKMARAICHIASTELVPSLEWCWDDASKIQQASYIVQAKAAYAAAEPIIISRRESTYHG